MALPFPGPLFPTPALCLPLPPPSPSGAAHPPALQNRAPCPTPLPCHSPLSYPTFPSSLISIPITASNISPRAAHPPAQRSSLPIPSSMPHLHPLLLINPPLIPIQFNASIIDPQTRQQDLAIIHMHCLTCPPRPASLTFLVRFSLQPVAFHKLSDLPTTSSLFPLPPTRSLALSKLYFSPPPPPTALCLT